MNFDIEKKPKKSILDSLKKNLVEEEKEGQPNIRIFSEVEYIDSEGTNADELEDSLKIIDKRIEK